MFPLTNATKAASSAASFTDSNPCQWFESTTNAWMRTGKSDWARPRTPRIKSLSSGEGLNRRRPCTVRVVTSTTLPAGIYRSGRGMGSCFANTVPTRSPAKTSSRYRHERSLEASLTPSVQASDESGRNSPQARLSWGCDGRLRGGEVPGTSPEHEHGKHQRSDGRDGAWKGLWNHRAAGQMERTWRLRRDPRKYLAPKSLGGGLYPRRRRGPHRGTWHLQPGSTWHLQPGSTWHLRPGSTWHLRPHLRPGSTWHLRPAHLRPARQGECLAPRRGAAPRRGGICGSRLWRHWVLLVGRGTSRTWVTGSGTGCAGSGRALSVEGREFAGLGLARRSLRATT
jgi:hypothetical protein